MGRPAEGAGGVPATATALLTLRRLVPDFGGLPRPFWVLFGGTLVNRVGGFVIVFLAIYLTEVRVPPPPQSVDTSSPTAAPGGSGQPAW
jgi:hypothetical protein